MVIQSAFIHVIKCCSQVFLLFFSWSLHLAFFFAVLFIFPAHYVMTNFNSAPSTFSEPTTSQRVSMEILEYVYKTYTIIQLNGKTPDKSGVLRFVCDPAGRTLYLYKCFIINDLCEFLKVDRSNFTLLFFSTNYNSILKITNNIMFLLKASEQLGEFRIMELHK